MKLFIHRFLFAGVLLCGLLAQTNANAGCFECKIRPGESNTHYYKRVVSLINRLRIADRPTTYDTDNFMLLFQQEKEDEIYADAIEELTRVRLHFPADLTDQMRDETKTLIQLLSTQEWAALKLYYGQIESQNERREFLLFIEAQADPEMKSWAENLIEQWDKEKTGLLQSCRKLLKKISR